MLFSLRYLFLELMILAVHGMPSRNVDGTTRHQSKNLHRRTNSWDNWRTVDPNFQNTYGGVPLLSEDHNHEYSNCMLKWVGISQIGERSAPRVFFLREMCFGKKGEGLDAVRCSS